MSLRCLPWVAAAVLAAGCEFGQIPDKNKPGPNSEYDGALLQQNVRRVDEVLTDRVMRGQISRAEKQELFHDYIREQVADLVRKDIPEDQVWRFADVYRQMEDWQTTHELYTIAVSTAKTEDRRVNDSLRLAEATAQLGDVMEGMALVRSTFDVKPEGKAPILMATLYEFAPVAQGRGHDRELAVLLEEAARQHLQTIVDSQSDAGRLFMQARRYHLRQAWFAIIRLYRSEQDDEAMRAAIGRSETMMRRFASA
ncbi:MAG: hypothetical protein IH945_01340 [Armatimonadetes bacterium]|nr:hypothetical protein [Armatimonadota bacterium]